MKTYKCHKVVEAGEIADNFNAVTVSSIDLRDGERVFITMADSARITNMMAAYSAKMGFDDTGYLVRYDDGYLSWSPKAVFETGYALI